MGDWATYFAANVAAAAALLGLVFIAVSINLERILGGAGLPLRAIETLMSFVVILMVSSVLLIPGESGRLTGVLVVIVGALGWATTTRASSRQRHNLPPGTRPWMFWLRVLIQQAAALAFVAGGVVLLAGSSDGLYVVAGAVTVTYFMAVLNAWVLLVEINR